MAANRILVTPSALGTEEMPVMDVDEVVALERRIAEGGTPLLTLMTRAGHATADAAAQLAPAGARVLVLVGFGNNGGDGWIAAAELAQRGYDVTLATALGGGGHRGRAGTDGRARSRGGRVVRHPRGSRDTRRG